MRKVIGIGETILDILFRNGQPTAAVPGGSVFNGLVSLSRAGVPIRFISETGNDQVGNIILQFMRDNGMPTEHVNVFPDGKSPVSLAFLNERNDAAYLFYKDYPRQRLDVVWPEVNEARAKKAIVYYDPNFRSTYKEEAIKLAPTIIENLEYADIVRGSVDDFFYMYNLQDVDKIYKDKIKFYCRNFICTAGHKDIALRTARFSKDYPIPTVETVSTVGAGDNFNAGIIYGLLKLDIRYDDLNDLNEARWNRVMDYGIAFATESCRSLNNSISPEFAEKLKIEKEA